MSMRQEQSKQKQQYWQRHIHAWKESGASQAGYCREHNLNLKTFTYWRRKLTRKASTVTLVQMPSLSNIPAPIKLIVNDRFAIEIGDGFRPETLKQLVNVVRGL